MVSCFDFLFRRCLFDSCDIRPLERGGCGLRWLLPVAILLAHLPGLVAAELPEPYHWLDDQVGVVVELEQPAPTLRRFFQGPLGRRVAQLPPVRRWWSRQRGSVQATFELVARQLGFTPRELEQLALQRRMVLALWPPERPGADGKLLLLVDCGRKEHAERLGRGLRRLFHEEMSAWDHVTHGQYGYWLYQQSADESPPGETTIVGVLGPYLAVANDEGIYRQTLARFAARGEGSLALDASFRQARGQRLPRTLAWVFVKLPVWEQSIRQEQQLRRPSGYGVPDEDVLQIWPALRYLALGLRADEHLVCYGQLAYRRDRLPPMLARRLQALEGAGPDFAHLPQEVIAAASFHLDLHRLLQVAFQESDLRRAKAARRSGADAAIPTPEQAEESVPAAVRAGLLAAASLLRPSQTVALLAYHDEQGVLRLGWVAALGLKRRWSGNNTVGSPSQALEEVLPGLASLFGSLALGRKVVYRAEPPDSEAPRLLQPAAPQGTPPLPEGEPLPVFAVARDSLWAASAAEALRRYWNSPEGASLNDHACWRELQPAVPKPHHRLFVSLAELRRLLQQRPEAVPELFEPEKKHNPAAIARAARGAAELLAVADCVAAAAQVTAREIRFALVVFVQKQPQAAAPAPGP